MTIKKVGGIRFIRVGKFQLSFCVVKKRAPRTFSQVYHVGAHVVETFSDGGATIMPRFYGARFV